MRLLRQTQRGNGSQPVASPEPQQPASGRMRRHRTDSDLPPAPAGTPSRMMRSPPASRTLPRSNSDEGSGDSTLPTAWMIEDSSLRHPDPLCISCNASPKTSVYTNRQIPIDILEHRPSPSNWRSRTDSMSSSNAHAYYFEVTLMGTGASLDVAIGLACEKDTFGSWPGESPRSIGWGSDGLQVNGRPIDGAAGVHFKNGDVLGCGIETAGAKRVFFTYNSNLVLPPAASTAFLGGETRNCYPVISFRYGTSRNIVKANFGMDATLPFRWKNTEGITILSQQPGGSAYSPYQQDTIEVSRRASNGGDPLSSSTRSRSPSPYYSISEMPSSPTRDPIQTRSASYALSGAPPVPDTASPRYNVSTGNSSTPQSNYAAYVAGLSRQTQQKLVSPPPQPPSNSPTSNAPLPRGSYYGTRNNKRSSLVDDDPSAASLSEHLTLPSQTNNIQQNSAAHMNASLSSSEHRRQQHRVSRSARRVRSTRGHSPSEGAAQSSAGNQHGSPSSGMSHNSMMGYPPAHSTSRNNDSRHMSAHGDTSETSLIRTDSTVKQDETPQDRAFRPGAVSVGSNSVAAAAQDILGEAKTRSKKLSQAARDNEQNADLLAEMLDACKKDQEALQLKLNHALEQSDSIENLEELFGVNDGICTAIELGTAALKRAKEKIKKKKKVEGPTIELLVENEDVFSLICMLRAANEKRLEAAIALMKFARDSDRLRNEIRSSGGMHSFLTLVRTNGIVRELKIVGALAVAYVVPNFVLSSQTSASVGLKIMECLRFLVDSQGVSVNDISITQVEMCRAASVGVTFLWINSIQPLLLLSKDQGDNVPGTPNRPALARFGRPRSRIGGGDQGQESLEVKELSELAVALVVQLANISDSGRMGPEMGFGYNIVEQVCEVDAARPIAVREGLMRLLVDWIISKEVDKVRPAASALRYLISIEDKYMAGWIHSQVVNEGAVAEIVKLLNESVGHDVRVAVAEMLSALCCAPHTRAAVVEAKCVSYLVALLYEHTSPASEQMVHYAGSALLQLAAGALARASALAGSNLIMADSTPNKRDTVVNEILEGWAHGSFVQIALEHRGKLRSVSVEALRVLSEDTDPIRQTRLQLCGAGAGEALGKTLGAEITDIRLLSNPDAQATSQLHSTAKDIHESLRGLANILEPQKEPKISRRRSSASRRLSHTHALDAKDSLIKGCLDTVKSGGLDGLIWTSSLPYTPCLVQSPDSLESIDRMDLVDEACRLLANMSPLLLADTAASNGCAKWATAFFESLDGILKRSNDGDNVSDNCAELNIDALVGIGALAFYEPLKIRIVDKTLPKLLFLKSLSGERMEVANAASQVLLSLGFTEDEITVQVAGNNPKLLVDWFCLQRALIIQAMARTEIRTKVMEMWQAPFAETNIESSMKLMRQLSAQSVVSTGSGEDKSGGSDEIVKDLFENITGDGDTSEMRQTIMQQYRHVYESNGTRRASNDPGPRSRDLGNNISGEYESMIAPHSYPLNDTNVEKDWILSHCRTLGASSMNENGICPIGGTSDRIEKLLDSCFPSRLLKYNVIPMNDLRPESSFNFRALMMPQRRYFSFRREGQLLARLCEKQAAALDSDDIHWTLGFTNSTFAGEFVESLVQSLYLCPMITGISFTRNSDWHMMVREADAEGEGDEGAGLLANLTGSLPPWVSHLTFDNMLNDRDLRALVVILDTMGKLSSGQDVILEEEPQEDDDVGAPGARGQGKFDTVSIRNSPDIARESWTSLFKMLGKSGPAKRGLSSLALSSLKVLDLSGNKLGDEMCALVLERCHDRDSGCSLEQLDLSGNRIGRGISVVKVLRSYTEYYRYNQKQGVKMVRSSWKSSLHTLLLAENDLFLGQAGLEIFDLLKHNALCLRFLDLSSNGLEGDTYQLLAGSILKNTSLCHLNLSGNKFGSGLVDNILDYLISKGTGCGLSFLLLENNSPMLNEGQRRKLGEFLKVSRKNAIERFVKERDEGHDTFEMPGLEMFNDSSNSNLLGTSFARRGSASRRLNAPEPEDGFDSGDSGENMITVLFSAPLVFADEENRLHPFAKLDFEMERELLWQCMKEASRDIAVSFDNAHHSRLLATLTKRCSCLHYSGHGHPHFLPFEDGMGGPNWLNVQDIKELIVRDGNAPFKFVFVSACHSGLAGETFASAGVPHVVCCQQESELKDTAALAFTRSFYLALAIGQTVKESFDQGCKAVRATPNLRDPEKEMEKFVLLPRDGNHDVPVFNAKPVREWPKQPRNQLMSSKSSRRGRGSLMRMRSIMTLGAKSSELSVRNMMQEDPSPTAPQFFLGREVDIYYILTAILKMRKRLVSILGETGIGRSSLACALCHYINERASTITEIQRIYFIKPKHGGRNVSCRSLLKQLVDKLAEAGKNRPMDEDTDTESILEWVCKSLKNDKALIVFDRTELLDKSDESQELPMVLSTLLYETKQVKVLLTGKHPLGQPSIGGQVEHPFHLGPLNVTNTVRLFVNLCPHLHTPSDRSKLFNRVTNACGEGADLLPGDPQMDSFTKEILSLVGEGVPAKIEKAAYSISQEGLSRLRDLAS